LANYQTNSSSWWGEDTWALCQNEKTHVLVFLDGVTASKKKGIAGMNASTDQRQGAIQGTPSGNWEKEGFSEQEPKKEGSGTAGMGP